MARPSGKQTLLTYLKNAVGKWVHNQEFRDATGLNDVPRTIRLLRQEGWPIEVRGDGYVMLASLNKGEGRGKRAAISQKVRYLVFSRDNFICKGCGRGPDDGVKLTVDHIRPVDWGGDNDISNLQTLCEECNHGKQAWIDSAPSKTMKEIMDKPTVDQRIEALFDALPNQDIPSTMVQMVSKGAFDWQRALRRVRERTGKRISPAKGKTAYRYFKD